jgi:secondary thiamine-phosphate synthase enzyme
VVPYVSGGPCEAFDFMEHRTIEVDTTSRRVVDLTDEVAGFCRRFEDGLVNLLALHATCGLALMETGSGSESDLASALTALLPRDDRYSHSHGSTGHGADHLVPVFISPALTLPVDNGRLVLGTWQRVVLVDLNEDNPRRQVRLSFLSEAPASPTPPKA